MNHGRLSISASMRGRVAVPSSDSVTTAGTFALSEPMNAVPASLPTGSANER